jgi:Domain of unknown function (DU1801)
MAELKTKKTDQSVAKFIANIQDDNRRADCEELVALMTKVTKEEPKMWGESIVGFCEYHYVYATGREGDWPRTGFSPRKQNLTLYFMCNLERHPALTKETGKFKTGKCCLYLKRLADIDRKTIIELTKSAITYKTEKAQTAMVQKKVKKK